MDDSVADSQSEFDEGRANSVLGKRVLVGITRLSRSEEVLSTEQFHGEIIRASRADGIIVRLSGTDEERWLPPDLSRLESAKPGEYRLRSTGEVVVDPDFVSMWTLYPPEN
jgi:hypothetical protein